MRDINSTNFSNLNLNTSNIKNFPNPYPNPLIITRTIKIEKQNLIKKKPIISIIFIKMSMVLQIKKKVLKRNIMINTIVHHH
jgi:hypothetical protein